MGGKDHSKSQKGILKSAPQRIQGTGSVKRGRNPYIMKDQQIMMLARQGVQLADVVGPTAYFPSD